jgi:hypothetical protein
MAERFAVTGYLADASAKQLSSQRSGHLEVRPERGYTDVVMRVDRADVTEVRTGSSVQGETLVQLILRDGANVETIIRTTADIRGITRFYDPTLTRLTAAATVKVIEA